MELVDLVNYLTIDLMESQKIINRISSELIMEMDELYSNWSDCEYALIANSGINFGFKVRQKVSGSKGEIQDGGIAWLKPVRDDIVHIFKLLNANEKINKITFTFRNRQLFEVVKSWDQSVQDEFEMYLPKSKKGKIRAWYLPPLEESSHTMEEMQEVIKLPKTTVQFAIDRNQPVETLITELNRAVFYPEDPLWDGAFYWIKKVDGVFTTHCDLFLFPSLEDKEAGFQAEETTAQLEVSEDMKELYDLIVARYAAENPDVPFDSIFVTV